MTGLNKFVRFGKKSLSFPMRGPPVILTPNTNRVMRLAISDIVTKEVTGNDRDLSIAILLILPAPLACNNNKSKV